MDFQVEANRIYYADPQGRLLAEITFPETTPGVVEINRTYVDESLRGQGIAGLLMAAAVDALRKTGRKAVPACSYAVKWLEKHPEASKEVISRE